MRDFADMKDFAARFRRLCGKFVEGGWPFLSQAILHAPNPKRQTPGAAGVNP
jgi:hypothetical protein